MAKLYARLVEKGEKNFNDIMASTKISEELKEQIKLTIISDGYTINDDGTVTKNEN